MRALCDSRPTAGQECGAKSAARDANVGAGALGALLGALRSRRATAVGTGAAGALGRREMSALRIANRYINARMSGRNADVLRLVADDVRLTSSRDGVVHGKKGFADYLERVKASGKWNLARWDAANKRAEVRGLVRIVFVNVNVVAHFGFDRRGRINDIYVGTKR